LLKLAAFASLRWEFLDPQGQHRQKLRAICLFTASLLVLSLTRLVAKGMRALKRQG
jgi:hypothetical protein